ncbi:MAG: hypothetical protein Q8O93_05285 [bacterium]|nr:hypothetical protein [bacterium]
MNGYIYLNFNDLTADAQDNISGIAREEVKAETTQDEADDLRMNLDDLINERVSGKLLSFSNDGKLVFNV